MQTVTATAHADRHSKYVTLHCRQDQLLQVVQPIVEMAAFVQGLGMSTSRKEFVAKTEALQRGKAALAKLMEVKFHRPFWPERFSNMQVQTNILMGGHFDLTFSETTPSREGGIVDVFKIRLVSSERISPLERFLAFARANNPQMAGSDAHEFARQMMQAAGI